MGHFIVQTYPDQTFLSKVERTTVRDFLDDHRSFDEYSMPKFVDQGLDNIKLFVVTNTDVNYGMF